MSDARGPVIVIASPDAGHATEVGQVVKALEAAGVEVAETALVSALADESALGRQWRDAGYSAAVAAGGDGTIGAVAGHLAGSDLPLGILPLGTGNDVARSLDIPLALDAACALIAHGHAAPIDLGQVIARPPAIPAMSHHPLEESADAPTAHSASGGDGSYFLHALTLGLNVEFARLATSVAQRQRWGRLNYAASALEALGVYRSLPLTVRLESVVASGYGLRLPPRSPTNATGLMAAERSAAPAASERTIVGEVIQLAAVVTPIFGGQANLRLPDVALRDGLLDFVIIEAMTPEHLTNLRERLARWTMTGRAPTTDPATDPASAASADTVPQHLDLPGVWRFQARAATIVQPEHVDVTLDGEMRARTPLRIQVADDALQVILPATLSKEVTGG